MHDTRSNCPGSSPFNAFPPLSGAEKSLVLHQQWPKQRHNFGNDSEIINIAYGLRQDLNTRRKFRRQISKVHAMSSRHRIMEPSVCESQTTQQCPEIREHVVVEDLTQNYERFQDATDL